jgi:hypothetical protein
MSRIRKTEHAGAKNSGGFWGTREEAKTLSKKLRRTSGKKTIQEELKSAIFHRNRFWDMHYYAILKTDWTLKS